MIALESKTQTITASSPLNLGSKEADGKGVLSFSELLRGASAKKTENTVQNGILVLALDEKSISNIKSLKDDNKIALELNPELTKNLTPAELKVLIKDAKKYLKTKILASEGFKKSEIAALPKTLKGLAQVASKLGLDLSKITLEAVKSSVSLADKKAAPKTLQLGSQELDDSSKRKLKTQESANVDLDLEIKKSSKKVQTQLKPELAKENSKLDEKVNLQVKSDIRTEHVPKEIKATPLFKAQASKEITTEQLVNTKINTVEANVPKKRENETLKLLLRGEKSVKTQSGFTADFSVATARVLAPEAPAKAHSSLESLLKGDKPESDQASKLDGLNVAKADSFEIKLSEAKQMTKYLSQNVKTAIEDYKSPFTRVKVELNPQRLGSVELTVVQRGKNLHINLSSNNAAINALALNANDLKVQLSNTGINNASLNFNSNSQSSDQGGFGQQQQNSHRREEAREEYNYLQGEGQNEEILNSLEIVVPHYA